MFVPLRPDEEVLDGLAGRLWALLEKHFIYRLVLEMDEIDILPSKLIGQLVMLNKRVLSQGGALRLCGLREGCIESLRICRLEQALPNYDCREDAVRGLASTKPR